MAAAPEEIVPGLWRWTARHPQWHPGEFGSEVACFVLRAGGDVLAVDPLLPEDPRAVLDRLDALVEGRLAILTTTPYHVRSAERLWERHRAAADVTIWGHPAAAKRLSAARPAFRDIRAAKHLPGGARSFAIGSPVRFERPLLLPSHDALVFGDAVAAVDGELRVWVQEPVAGGRSNPWYRDRFLPTLAALLDLRPQRILVTHGEPVLADGTAALAAALAREPWAHR
jgi:hypothetical protein